MIQPFVRRNANRQGPNAVDKTIYVRQATRVKIDATEMTGELFNRSEYAAY